MPHHSLLPNWNESLKVSLIFTGAFSLSVSLTTSRISYAPDLRNLNRILIGADVSSIYSTAWTKLLIEINPKWFLWFFRIYYKIRSRLRGTNTIVYELSCMPVAFLGAVLEEVFYCALCQIQFTGYDTRGDSECNQFFIHLWSDTFRLFQELLSFGCEVVWTTNQRFAGVSMILPVGLMLAFRAWRQCV